MESKKNKYQPETEFEKKEFSELIDDLQSMNEEEVSENFDDQFFKKLQKVKPLPTLSLRMKSIISWLQPKPRMKVYAAVAVVAVILLLIIIMPFRTTQLPEKGIVQRDTLQLNIEKGTPNLNLKTQRSITNEAGKQIQSKTGELARTSYLKGLINDLDQKYGLALSAQNNSLQLLEEISESDSFKQNIEAKKSFSRDDTLKLFLQLLKNAKK